MGQSINAELLLASMNAMTGDILYTFILRYPRFILPEVNTHRVFSRNTASSRAKPAKVIRKQVWEDPVVPIYIGSNKKGMQAGEELTGITRGLVETAWKAARIPALVAHWGFEKLGVHKQITNRLLEPWIWCEQLVSFTEVNNFLTQRNHRDAEPHFHLLAGQVAERIDFANRWFSLLNRYGKARLNQNQFQVLQPGEWHLPFVNSVEGTETNKKVSAARCARVSYNLPDTGKLSTIEKDLELYDRLAGSVPRHLSPLEHQATPLSQSVFCGNFRGWKQFRKEIPGESGD